MAGQQRVYKQKIRATKTLEKVFRAMELIAASRIGKARERAQGQDPYTLALIRSIGTVAAHATDLDHPLITPRTDTNRVAVLIVTSDRGMAGAYSSSVLREAEKLLERLREDGKDPVLFVFGRRGESYFKFRKADMARVWTGSSDNPSTDTAQEIADELLGRFLAPVEEGGVSELHVVFTRFESMVKQVVQVRRMLPLEVVEADPDEETEEVPLYEFEPSPKELFDALLPMYVSQRIHGQLLMAAASELASRQQAMHAATENANELIQDYTRLANNARQAEITTEITELISGADALENAS
ncbi:F0F1 ATP synthase subunit gamma [Flaviflexus massiliensis]|uniref:F0F1 ATP synthase subunit gamma n=1 Tax=Flaviflexus massiliensis TaxID=1522309 RepID=UPI0006D5B777|nr:F0F1 ATP synthase subunit gamma [Flaviflexus massiliensis]